MITIHLMHIEALDKSYRMARINDPRVESLKFLIFQFWVMLRCRCCMERTIRCLFIRWFRYSRHLKRRSLSHLHTLSWLLLLSSLQGLGVYAIFSIFVLLTEKTNTTTTLHIITIRTRRNYKATIQSKILKCNWMKVKTLFSPFFCDITDGIQYGW